MQWEGLEGLWAQPWDGETRNFQGEAQLREGRPL